jgi:hypothetical protein
MRRIYRALNLTAFAESQTLDGIRREEHIDRLWRIISLRGTQKSEALFGHLEPAFHDDRLSLWLRRIATPIFAAIFTRATLVALVAALAATLIITPLLVVTAITSTALSAAAAAALIVALPLMATVSLMVTTMTTSTTTATTLTEATLATARTEGTLMALLTLRPALLGISLKPGGIASTGAGVTRVGAVGRLR